MKTSILFSLFIPQKNIEILKKHTSKYFILLRKKIAKVNKFIFQKENLFFLHLFLFLYLKEL